MTRLFIAIPLPLALKQSLSKLQFQFENARWVPIEQMHITVCFIGSVSPQMHEKIRLALMTVERPPFTLGWKGGGRFPPKGRPRVLYLGAEALPELMRLHRDIIAVLQKIGVEVEQRSFVPHVTLVRLKADNKKVREEFLHDLDNLSLGAIKVDRFELIRSELSAQGATHTPDRAYLLERESI